MPMINCRVLRTAVGVAVTLFIIGFVLQAPRLIFAGDMPELVTLLSGTGLVAILVSPVIMATAALFALVPGIAKELETCNH